jgi:N-carbamoylputrescine amidase
VAVNVGIVQFSPDKGKLDGNLDRIAEHLVQCSNEGIQLAIFPETCTTGYFLEGGVLELAISSESLAQKLNDRVQGKLSKPIEFALGFYELLGGNVYNSAGFCRFDGTKVESVKTYQKIFLPTYGVFDEDRFVSKGKDLCILETTLGKTALMICEDVWHSILPTLNAVAGATAMIIPSASPARGFRSEHIENHERYQRLVRAISEEHGVYSFVAQLVGHEGGKGFVGGSMICDPLGRILVEAPVGVEAIISAEIDLELVSIARAQTPLISDLQSSWHNVLKIANEIG